MAMFGLEGWNYVVIILGGALSLFATVFGFGYFFNKKIREAAAETMKELSDNVGKLQERVQRLEEGYVPTERYERDLNNIHDTLKDFRSDVKAGFASITGRIDAVILKS